MATKLFFKHLNGYLNINDDWIAFTANGNWSELDALPSSYRIARKKLRIKRCLTAIIVGAILFLLFQFMKFSGFRILRNHFSSISLLALSSILAIVFNHHYNSLQGIRLKIPNDENVGFQFEGQVLVVTFIDQIGNIEKVKVQRLKLESMVKIRQMVEEKTIRSIDDLDLSSHR